MKDNIQKPKGEFRRYIQWEGRWCHVYVVSTHYQLTLIGKDQKMVDFKLSKKSKVVHSAARERFFKDKPKTRKNVERIA